MIKGVEFPSEGLVLHGVITQPDQVNKGVLFVHGGGHANLGRYAFLQNYFALKSIVSLAFDSRGCGSSQGKFDDGTLLNRVTDAKNALEYLRKTTRLPWENLWLWGSSMGGHVVCRLTEAYPTIAGVILQSAAAYGRKTESLRFNRSFSAAIRQPDSWRGSPAFKTLRRFPGKTLVVYSRQDTIVPDGVKQAYKSACKRPSDYVVLSGGKHALLRPSNPGQQSALDRLAALATSIILK
ncbi:lysophospholipase [Patescibacteria group bacterium]|nr:lysophospholipase [Patescibacteria group bacterium]MCL5091237.1 lysophospholipase [Patescibacteria group bacterium]